MKGNCSKRTTGPKHQNKLFIGTTTFDKVSNIDKFLRNIVVNSLSGDDSKIFFAHASSREENPSIHFHRKEDEKTSSILTVILLLLYIIFKQTPGLFAISFHKLNLCMPNYLNTFRSLMKKEMVRNI